MPKLLTVTIVALCVAVLWFVWRGVPPEEEMARTRERDREFARDFHDAWEKRVEERDAAVQECIQRKQKLNPTWEDGNIGKACSEEVSKRPWR